MDPVEKDKGVLAVLLKRFENERYPIAKKLEEKVNNGVVLAEQDLSFIEQALSDAHQVMALISKHPEYAGLAKNIFIMYENIMTKSQENSKK